MATNVVTLTYSHCTQRPLMDYEIDVGCNGIILIITSSALIPGFNIRRSNWLRNCFCGGNVRIGDDLAARLIQVGCWLESKHRTRVNQRLR